MLSTLLILANPKHKRWAYDAEGKDFNSANEGLPFNLYFCLVSDDSAA